MDVMANGAMLDTIKATLFAGSKDRGASNYVSLKYDRLFVRPYCMGCAADAWCFNCAHTLYSDRATCRLDELPIMQCLSRLHRY